MQKLKFYIILTLVSLVAIDGLFALPKDYGKKKDEPQRTVSRVYDVQRNTVSNIDFYSTNYGIFGLDIERNVGGGFWPRGSQNQYIFGGGVWFAAVKRKPGDTTYKKYVELSYNPNSGSSWFVPGRISDGDALDNTDVTKYRLFFSTDYRKSDGTPIDGIGPIWPIWDASNNPADTLKNNRYFGYYIPDNGQRKTEVFPKGPAIISGEDIFSTYKDTDLGRFEGGLALRKAAGYPLRLQLEQTIYSWGFGDYRDFIFLRYDIINFSDDTLLQCWMAPVMDIDIALRTRSQAGAANDRTRYYVEEDHLNLAIQWSNGDQGEQGNGFGYLGFNFLESPAVLKNEGTIDTVVNGVPQKWYTMCADSKVMKVDVKDSTGAVVGQKDSLVCTRRLAFPPNMVDFVRKDKRAYTVDEQLGLKTMRNWNISEDIPEDDQRYNFLSSKIKDGDLGPGDKRFMMSTGPFNVMPKDTVRVVVGIILANPAVKKEPDGSTEDVAELIRKVKFAQKVYDDNFRAPEPPERAKLSYTPLNNAIKIQWDNTSELSVDRYERGLAFMGYKLYRARRIDVDTFDVNVVSPNSKYTRGKNPLGWKQIAEYQLPTPFQKSYLKAGLDQTNASNPFLDSLRFVGPVFDAAGNIDTFVVKVFRIPRGVSVVPNTNYNPFRMGLSGLTGNKYLPVIAYVDSSYFTKPWGPFYKSLINDKDLPMFHDPYSKNPTRHFLIDSIMLGTLTLNRALLDHNPIYYTNQTINILPADTGKLPDKNKDTIYLKNTYKEVWVNGVKQLTITRKVPLSIYGIMADSNHLKTVSETIYSLIKNNQATIKFPNFEQSDYVRKNIIAPYMDSITNGRTYIDIGDDNRNGVIDLNTDPTKTEKLLNNIDYYYTLLSYDEGDIQQPTPSKLNDAAEGLPNLIKVFPKASPIGNDVKFDITYVDSAKIGGLFNFKFFGIDRERLNQLFSGKELEIEFNPTWNESTILFQGRGSSDKGRTFGLYSNNITVKDVKTQKVLFNANTFFEPDPCRLSYRGLFTEDGASFVYSDTAITDPITGKVNTFGLPTNNDNINVLGKFSSGDFTRDQYCYSFGLAPEAWGVFGFSFDFYIQQRGGMFRPYSINKVKSNAVTPLVFIHDSLATEPTRDRTKQATIPKDKILTTQAVYAEALSKYIGDNLGLSYIPRVLDGSFNNGPGEYLVTFMPGGKDTLELSFGGNPPNNTKSNTFIVDYLTMKIENTISMKRPNPIGSDSTEVRYPGEIQHMVLPDSVPSEPFYPAQVDRYWPDPRNLVNKTNDFINKYNLFAYGWIDGRGVNTPTRLAGQFARPNKEPYKSKTNTYVGKQGRYYLSAKSIDGANQLDFVNMLNISGCYFVFDYANKGRKIGVAKEWDFQDVNTYQYGEDFKAGDQVMVTTTGGALGLPLPGAKVRVKLSEHTSANMEYTDEQMKQVKIVPNPYYIDHQGQRSPYDAKIYFTKLPSKCTIDIYTINGDLVRSIEHNETNGESIDKHALEVWDLLSKNRQRVQSQTLVAVITAPNGAKTIQNFSLVVGGFRIIPDDVK